MALPQGGRLSRRRHLRPLPDAEQAHTPAAGEGPTAGRGPGELEPANRLTMRRRCVKTGEVDESVAPHRNATSAGSERPTRRLGATTGLRVEVTIRRAEGAAAEELRERQLRAVLRLLQRAAALQAETRRAA
jgi:hypothetical protein